MHSARFRAFCALCGLIIAACGDNASPVTKDAGHAPTGNVPDSSVSDAGPSQAMDSGSNKPDAAEAEAEISQDEFPIPDGGGPAELGSAERGAYLVDHVLMCGVCHTPNLANTTEPDPAKYLAGSRSYDFKDIDGTIVTVNAENLTSHDPEGLHAWSDGQIRRAITVGIDDEMFAIYPIMPYPEYSLLKPEDVDSIIKYLRTVPPNGNVVAADYPYADQHAPVPPIDDAKIPHTTLPASDPSYAAAERGRYFAKTACLNCHTEELSHGVPDMSKAFAGGKKYTFVRNAPEHTSTNLTPHATGLATWSIDDIVAAIKTNKEKGTNRELCNTHPGGPERLGKMTDADARDLATYIHTLPAVANGPFTCLAK
jgi:mono/diheme cytochrome c family protein